MSSIDFDTSYLQSLLMIQGIANMLKLTYFSDYDSKYPNTKSFRKYRPPHLQNYVGLSELIMNPQTSYRSSKMNAKKINEAINSYQDVADICNLITSEQRCQNWIVLLENYKNNYIVKQKLYNSILKGTVNVHNLFLMMIQCRVLPEEVWIPLEMLCQLKGDRDNELCCLIHFTVTSMGKKFQSVKNPEKWSKQKGLLEMGKNFQKIYNNSDLTLQQKISILPMLIVLNNKNCTVLWFRLKWLQTFSYEVIKNLRSNMRKLLQQRVSVTMSQQNTDYFTQKMCIKSIQLLEVQGFVSGKNLFSYAYELYSISQLLTLMANYQAEQAQDEQITSDKNRRSMFRLQLIDFLLQLFDCIETYEYDFETTNNINTNMNSKCNCDMANIRQIIVKNKLYIEELKGINFNRQIQTVMKAKYIQKNIIKVKSDQIKLHSTIEQATQSLQNLFTNINTNSNNNLNIQNQYKHLYQGIQITKNEQFFRFPKNNLSLSVAKFTPRSNSLDWFHEDNNSILFTPSFYDQSHHSVIQENIYPLAKQDQYMPSCTPEQTLKLFISQRQQTILNHILSQLYHLKTDYLQLLYAILSDCYICYSSPHISLEQPWTENSSIFCKLQLYLIKNFILDFLVGWFSSIETKNNPVTMICFYGVIGLLLKSNPISYGKIDKIIYNIEQQMSSPRENLTKKMQEQVRTKKATKKREESYSHPHPPLHHIEYFSNSFLSNAPLCRSAIFILLSDQFEWKQNQTQSYENKHYKSLFVKRVIEDNRIQWMVTTIESICSIFIQQHSEQIQSSENKQSEGEKYQWITFLLTLYYYFQQTMESNPKRVKDNLTISKCTVNQNGKSQTDKIDAPKSTFLDKLLQKQKFMEILYPMKIKIDIQKQSKQKSISNKGQDNKKNKKSSAYKQQRMLLFLTQILDKWEQHYNNPCHSKKSILQYNLNYSLLRLYKKKLKNRICGFVKTKQYEQNGEQYYHEFVKKSKGGS